MSLPSVLQKILAAKREEVEVRRSRTPQRELQARLADTQPRRGFHAALASRADKGRAAIIAEFKRASPSAGWIAEHANPTDIAQAYEQGGAACLSVLTDVDFFRGSDNDLVQARAACSLPVIRKDFIVDDYQVYETRALGADAMLLIVAALDDAELAGLSELAADQGLDVLVEVHDERELDRAIAVPGRLLGINNRDLHRFETRLETSERLAPGVPEGRLVVAESGLHARADIERLQAAGIHAFLIGEALMRASKPEQMLATFTGA